MYQEWTGGLCKKWEIKSVTLLYFLHGLIYKVPNLPNFTEEVLNLLIRSKHLFMLSYFPQFAKWIKLVPYSNCKNQILTE